MTQIIAQVIEWVWWAWDKIGSFWWFFLFTWPTVKGFYVNSRRKARFREIFGLTWPNSDEERQMTAYPAEQTLSALRWEAQAVDGFSGLEDRADKAEEAEELLAAAGYGNYINDLPEDDEDEDTDEDEEDNEEEDEDEEDEDYESDTEHQHA